MESYMNNKTITLLQQVFEQKWEKLRYVDTFGRAKIRVDGLIQKLQKYCAILDTLREKYIIHSG